MIVIFVKVLFQKQHTLSQRCVEGVSIDGGGGSCSDNLTKYCYYSY